MLGTADEASGLAGNQVVCVTAKALSQIGLDEVGL